MLADAMAADGIDTVTCQVVVRGDPQYAMHASPLRSDQLGHDNTCGKGITVSCVSAEPITVP